MKKIDELIEYYIEVNLFEIKSSNERIKAVIDGDFTKEIEKGWVCKKTIYSEEDKTSVIQKYQARIKELELENERLKNQTEKEKKDLAFEVGLQSKYWDLIKGLLSPERSN